MMNSTTKRRLHIIQSHVQSYQQQHPSIVYTCSTSAAGLNNDTKFQQLVYVKKSNHYREATRVETSSKTLNQLRQQVASSSGLLLIKNKYAGIQASEIMISNGVYGPLSKLGNNFEPVVAGGEACGEVIDLSPDLKQQKNSKYYIGSHALFADFSHGYVEYHVIHYKKAIPIPESTPEFVSIIVSGTTAYLALQEKAGLTQLEHTTQYTEQKKHEHSSSDHRQKVCLVTGASGATGTFAVQFAKRLGFHVVGTCGDDQKKELLLNKLQCDHAINYKTENLTQVLKTRYPNGIDLIYEGVGGSMFDTAVKHLAKFGHLIIIGSISDYKADNTKNKTVPIQQSAGALGNRLLFGSKSVSGFFLLDYTYGSPQEKEKFSRALQTICKWYYYDKTLQVPVDTYCFQHLNKGVSSVQDAVDYLHSGKNIGKVFVQFA